MEVHSHILHSGALPGEQVGRPRKQYMGGRCLPHDGVGGGVSDVHHHDFESIADGLETSLPSARPTAKNSVILRLILALETLSRSCRP